MSWSVSLTISSISIFSTSSPPTLRTWIAVTASSPSNSITVGGVIQFWGL